MGVIMDVIILIENGFMCPISKYSSGEVRLDWKRKQDGSIRNHVVHTNIASGKNHSIDNGIGFILNNLEEWDL